MTACEEMNEKKVYGQSIAWHPVGKMAYELITKYGSVAGMDGGEDSSGRSKSRLQTPEELVDRCIAIAEKFFHEGSSAGHIGVTNITDFQEHLKCLIEEGRRREGDKNDQA